MGGITIKTSVQSFYDFEQSKYKLFLHAGKSGIRNTVSWIYLAEDIQNMNFLKGGELVITTGLFITGGTALFDFIQALSMRNCSCVIINTGKYLQRSDITPEIIEYCDNNNLPLFTMPWEIHLIDIMQDYCRILLLDSQCEDSLSAAFQSALYQSTIPENILRTLNQSGFLTATNYRIIVIRNLTNTTLVTSPLNHCDLKYHLFYFENLQILFYQADEEVLPLSELIRTLSYCDSIILGVSDIMNSIMDISSCYKKARFSLAVAELWKRTHMVFDDLGIFQLFFSTSDPELLHRIVQRNLGTLQQYDLEHDTDYLNTLREYLLSDGNLVETANKLYTHRNTVVYRINKIKELLGSDIHHSTNKFDLLMAYYVLEYFSIA
jgi:sulfur relay (sulfurtransferase) DsrF/TusC family protein